MQEIIDEYGTVLLYLIVAALVVALIVATTSEGSIVSEWVTKFAHSLGG